VRHQDAYKSIVESLIHAGVDFSTRVNIKSVDTDKLFPKDKVVDDEELQVILKDVDGILIPGGFGVRVLKARSKL